MPFVTGAILEGERECNIDEPTWEDVVSLFETMLRFDRDEAHGTLTLEGAPSTQLTFCLGHTGALMVNWHDWDTGESWVVRSQATGIMRVRDAEYPASDFVDAPIALAAAKDFYETGARTESLEWER